MTSKPFDLDHIFGPDYTGPIVMAATREILRGPKRSFQVFSRAEVRNPFAFEPHILISIHGSDQSETPVCRNEHCRDVLAICFDDIRHDMVGCERFHRWHAKQVVDFVEAHPDTLVVVQCQAGISRSAAVAAELSHWLNGEGHDEAWFTQHFAPNTWVRQVLRGYLERRKQAL